MGDGLSAAGGGISSGGGDSNTGTAGATAGGLASFAALMWTVRTFTVPGVQRVISRFLTPADMVQYGRMFSEGGVFMCTARNVRSLMAEGMQLCYNHPDQNSPLDWQSRGELFEMPDSKHQSLYHITQLHRAGTTCRARGTADALPLARLVRGARSTWPAPFAQCARTHGHGECHTCAEVIHHSHFTLHIPHVTCHTSHFTLLT